MFTITVETIHWEFFSTPCPLFPPIFPGGVIQSLCVRGNISKGGDLLFRCCVCGEEVVGKLWGLLPHPLGLVLHTGEADPGYYCHNTMQ